MMSTDRFGEPFTSLLDFLPSKFGKSASTAPTSRTAATTVLITAAT